MKTDHDLLSENAPRAAAGGEDAGSRPVDATPALTPAADSNGPPLPVTRGSKSQPVEAGIDWFRVAGPLMNLDQVTQQLSAHFGPSHPRKGMWFYDAGRQWDGGVMVLHHFTDRDEPGMCLDLPGKALASLDFDQAIQLMRDMMWGRHATRFDLRLDFGADHVGLIDDVLHSCLRDELCGCRTWELREPRRQDGRILGRGVNLGRRGKNGSGRYVRVYDKGLETGEKSPGQWERWEVEFTGVCAAEVSETVLSSEDPTQEIARYALGAIDFRVNTESRELARRPRSPWFAQLLAAIEPKRAKKQRLPTSYDRFAGWLRRCAAPTLTAMAQHTGERLGEVIEYLATGVRPNNSSPQMMIVSGYLNEKQSGRAARFNQE